MLITRKNTTINLLNVDAITSTNGITSCQINFYIGDKAHYFVYDTKTERDSDLEFILEAWESVEAIEAHYNITNRHLNKWLDADCHTPTNEQEVRVKLADNQEFGAVYRHGKFCLNSSELAYFSNVKYWRSVC
jgi:hypothetical protein